MKPPFYQKKSPLLLAGLGLLGLAAYFFVMAGSPLARLLRFEKTREEILAQAQQAFEASPLAQAGLHRDHEVTVSNELLQYAQQHTLPDSARAQLSYARWEVRWGGEIKTEEGKKQKSHFALEYDLSGKLVGFSQSYPGLKDSVKVPEAEAMRRAKEFLHAQGLDTATVRLSQKKITEEDQVSKYNFKFERAFPLAGELTENFSIDVAGSEVTDFNRTVNPAKSNEDQFDAEKIAEIVAFISAVVTWMVFGLFLAVIFFRRFRHDELEFKRAWWWGLLGFVLTAAMATFQTWPEWAGILLGSGLGGGFVGIALVLVFTTTDSFCRDICPEKMVLTDLVQRGQLRVQEIGAAILRAVFIAGAALLAWSLILRLTPLTGWGYFEIDQERLWFLRDRRYWAGNTLSLLIGVCFTGLILVSFWQAYLQSKIKRSAIFFIAFMLSLHLAGFYNQFIKPNWLGAILCLPLTALWTYFLIREDFLTSFCALAIFYLFSSLAISPASLIAGPLPWYVLWLLIFVFLGVFFYRSPHRAEDFEDYVPEYVSRIAARERFLKELEIARNVQMRFLPARTPQFPGLELASICRPAMEVGGDYFDFVPHGQEALSVFIGDVSGKGVSAAFFMTMAKGIIKTLVKRMASPKQLLTEMNEVFYENSPKEIFISLIYGYFDMNKKTLTFARAGHNPLIVHKSQGEEPELLHPKGLAIGMDSGVHFARTIEEITVPLAPGDTFVFYTDGISESMNTEGEEFGEDKLCVMVNAGVNEGATALLERITAEVNAFAEGAQQHDDFTMVVVKVKGVE